MRGYGSVINSNGTTKFQQSRQVQRTSHRLSHHFWIWSRIHARATSPALLFVIIAGVLTGLVTIGLFSAGVIVP